MTAQKVVESELPVTMPGYKTNEVNGFIDWVVWTLKRYEAGHKPDRTSVMDRHRSAQAPQNEPAETTPAAKPPTKLNDTEPPIVESPEPADESSPQRRPMTSDELLEQAKKWMNR